MGLLDILNGMQNGLRGRPDPSSGSGGMSPITTAILGLLAYQAYKGFTGGGRSTNADQLGNGGGLSDLLGGLFAGGAAGSVLSGGLNDLLNQFQQSGHGETANSWVGTGPNKDISPNDLASALGADKIGALMSQSGMPREELLQGLSRYLPQVIDQLTPNGRLPTEQEAGFLV